MATLIKYKNYKCSNCGFEYQGVNAYVHSVLGIVCVDCMDVDVRDSEWA